MENDGFHTPPPPFRMRIALTGYSSQEELLGAIRDLPYRGRSKRIGDALTFLVHHGFGPVIRRDHSPKVWRVGGDWHRSNKGIDGLKVQFNQDSSTFFKDCWAGHPHVCIVLWPRSGEHSSDVCMWRSTPDASKTYGKNISWALSTHRIFYWTDIQLEGKPLVCVSYEVKWEQNEIRNAYKEELPPTEPCTLYDIVNEIGVVSSNAARF